jgi:hypothetical protein
MEEVKKTVTKVTFGQFNDVVNIETVDNTFNDEDDVLFVVEKDDEELLITKSAVDDTIKYFEDALNELDDMVFHDDVMYNVQSVTDTAITDILHDTYYALEAFIINAKKIMKGKINEVEDPNEVIEKLLTYLIDSIEPINDGGRLYI